MATALLRVHQALRDAGLAPVAGSGVQRVLTSMTNEVWFAGPYLVRISTRPGSRRLRYEAAVGSAMPPEVKYPSVVCAGVSGTAEWLILRRMPGRVLSEAWPGLDQRRRQYAVEELADALRALHGTPPPPGPDGRPLRPPFLDGETLECPHQLPPARLAELLARARNLGHVDVGVIDAARQLLIRLAPAVDGDPPPTGLVHGDLHFENVLWDGDHVSALLDLEWVRPGPPDLDLDVFLRFCADPELHVANAYRGEAHRADYAQVVSWLRSAYPELLSHPRLVDRLTVFGLSYDVRELMVDPPKGPPSTLPAVHPMHRIRRLVEGRTHLQWMDL